MKKTKVILLLFLTFHILCKNIECYLPSNMKRCPLIIADECLDLNKKLMKVSNNASIVTFLDYNLDSYYVKNLKKIYEHSYEIGLIQEFLHDKKNIRLLNMNMKRLPKYQDRYTIEAQSFNIFRAFLNGNYRNDETKMFTKKDLKEYQRRETLRKNKESQEDESNLFFFTENILYQGSMKRMDTFHEIEVDTSRHLILLEDIHIGKQNLEYLKSIKNPIGLFCRGRSSNKKLLQKIRQLLEFRGEDSKLVIILSFSKLQIARKQISVLLDNLSKEEKHQIIFCMEMVISSKVSSNKILKNVKFFKKVAEQNNFLNGGYYFKIDTSFKKKK